MMTVKLGLFFLSLLAPGYLALKLFFPRTMGGWLRNLALAYGLGWGIITVQLFIALFWLKLSLGNWLVWLFFVEDIILFSGYCLINKINFVNFKNSWLNGWRRLAACKTWRQSEQLLLIFILLFIVVALANALTQPLIAWDSLVNWSLKAKTIFKHGQIIFDAAAPSYWRDLSYPNYPWNFSLSLAWLSFLTGRFSDLANNLVAVSFYLGLIILVYDFLKRQTERRLALLFTFFLASAELLVYHSYNPYGELPLAFMALAAFSLLVEALQRPTWAAWLAAGVFGGLATMTKNEGIFYVLAAAPFIWLASSALPKKQILGRLGLYGAGLAIMSGAWWLFKLVNHLGIGNAAPGLVWHPEVIKNFLEMWFGYGGFNIFWTIMLVVLIVNFSLVIKRRLLAAAWSYLALIWLAFMYVYIFSNSYTFALDGTIILRNSLTFFPIALLLTALTFNSRLLRGEADEAAGAAAVSSLPAWLRLKFKETAVLARHKKLIKFLIVGTSGAAIDLAVLALAVEVWQWPPLPASVVSFGVALISNFFLNKFWTWRDASTEYRKQFFKFSLTSVAGLAINTALMWLFLLFGWYYLLAKAIVSLLVAVWNYCVNNWWTFKRENVNQ